MVGILQEGFAAGLFHYGASGIRLLHCGQCTCINCLTGVLQIGGTRHAPETLRNASYAARRTRTFPGLLEGWLEAVHDVLDGAHDGEARAPPCRGDLGKDYFGWHVGAFTSSLTNLSGRIVTWLKMQHARWALRIKH